MERTVFKFVESCIPAHQETGGRRREALTLHPSHPRNDKICLRSPVASLSPLRIQNHTKVACEILSMFPQFQVKNRSSFGASIQPGAPPKINGGNPQSAKGPMSARGWKQSSPASPRSGLEVELLGEGISSGYHLPPASIRDLKTQMVGSL